MSTSAASIAVAVISTRSPFTVVVNCWANERGTLLTNLTMAFWLCSRNAANNGRLTPAPVLFVGKTSAEDRRWVVSVSGKLILRTEIPYKSSATSFPFCLPFNLNLIYARNFLSVEQARINENFSSVSYIREDAFIFFFFFFFFQYTVKNSRRNFKYARYSDLLEYIYVITIRVFHRDFFLARSLNRS